MPKRVHILPLRRRKPEGMMPEQFYLLQKGDVIRSVKHGSPPRIIEETNDNDQGETYWIRLLKVQRSRYPNPYTLYCSTDASAFMPVKVKDERIWDMTYESCMEKRAIVYKKHHEQRLKEAEARIKRMHKFLEVVPITQT